MALKVPQVQRLVFSALLVAAALALPLAGAGTAHAQRGSFFDSLFGSFPNRPPAAVPKAAPERPADHSRAPAPRRPETPPANSVLVLGDSLADWLGFGLEEVLGDNPDLGVVRQTRAFSGLVRYGAGTDAPDWAQVAREAIAAEKPSFVVMMLGVADRQAIREQVPAPKPDDGEPAARPRPGALHEYRSERWDELYMERIDATIATLKSAGVPVFWMGLPSVRGARSTSDMLHLNALFRARAERAGIVFVDVWDGFVGEDGRFTLQGPDVEGQTRRLRTADGVHFTHAGARKLAHYLEREISRFSGSGPVPVALPAAEAMPDAGIAKPEGPRKRPLAGPVIPLTSPTERTEELLGGSRPAPAGHVVATRILVKGEAVEPPAGRGDDFAWPRRSVAPFDADPVVATTMLPLPEMQPPPAKTVSAPESQRTAAAAPRRAPRPQAAVQEPPPRRERQFQPFPFLPLFRLFGN